ncbi:MAG: acyl carrier protein [Candidatus Hydrogenedentota bacterium]
MPEDVNVAEEVKKLIVERFRRSEEEVTDDAKFVDDLNFDSLDITEMIMALEEEYNIDIVEEEANQIETVGDAIRHIEAKMKEG